MQLPWGYNRRLQRYDRDLRMRWSPSTERWLLERRARYERKYIDPDAYDDKEHDTYRQLADGYFTLGIYQPRDFPTVDQLIDYLKSQDMHALGKTAEQVADEMDADYYARLKARREATRRDVGDVGGEFWEADRWASGERVAVPAAFPGS